MMDKMTRDEKWLIYESEKKRLWNDPSITSYVEYEQKLHELVERLGL